MSGKQKECGYSWTSEGEIHTCNLPEGHTEAHICGFVFNPSDCCLERAEPTPPEGEAVPEQVCKTCDGKGVVRDTETELVVDCPECDNPNPPPLPREEWIPCPICQSEYDGVYCHACRNRPPAPVVSTAAPEPPITEMYLCETERLFLKPDQLYKFVVHPTCQRCSELSKIVAPESYKPAEGPEQSAMIALYAIIRESEFGRTGKLPSDDWICENMVWWLTHGVEIEKTREHYFLKPPAATPVTVEAPLTEWDFDIPKNNRFEPWPLGKGIPQEFISSLEKKVRADFDYPEGGIILSLIAEINRLRATPKPIGDVEAVARKCANATVGALIHAANKEKKISLNYLDELTIEIAAILSPFFAPAGPEKEKK